MNLLLLCEVESVLRRRTKNGSFMLMQPVTAQKISPEIVSSIEQRIRKGEKEATLYEVVIDHIKRLNNPKFYKKNGELKESAFYQYAYIDKSTWSELRWNLIKPKKKTLLKLVIALHLDEDEAVDLMQRGSNGFDPKDLRDQIILSLVELKCYDPIEVYGVLEEYRLNGSQKFENIYDMKE